MSKALSLFILFTIYFIAEGIVVPSDSSMMQKGIDKTMNRDSTLSMIGMSCSGEQWGTYLGEFNGVSAYSNCSTDYESNENNYDAGINTGMKWQCVEYVNRYYYVKYSIDIKGGNANSYFGAADGKGLRAYENGETTCPQVGDILCSDGGNCGHVAIVTGVTDDSVFAIQQNLYNDVRDINMGLGLSVSDGHYTLSGFGSSYSIQGWLRLPFSGQYLRQDPDSLLTLRTGQTQQVWVEFLNTGATTWTNDPDSASYVDLRCHEQGQYQNRESPFYHSSWMNHYTPTAVDYTHVPVESQDTGRFTFTIQAPQVEAPTTFHEYFQPFNPHTETWIEDDGDMHFVINVISDIVIDTTNRTVENNKIKLKWATNAVPDKLIGVYYKPYSTTTNLTNYANEEFSGYAGSGWYSGSWVRSEDTGNWEVVSVEADKAVIKITHSPVHQVPFITYYTIYSNSSVVKIDRVFQFSQYTWTASFLSYLWRCYHRDSFNTYYYSYNGGVKSGNPEEYGASHTDWDNRWADLYNPSSGVGIAVLNFCLNPYSMLYTDKDMDSHTSGATPIINAVSGGLRRDLTLTYFYYIHSGNYLSANLDSVSSALNSDVQVNIEPHPPLVLCPAGDNSFSVTVRDGSNNPLVGCYNVWLDFSNCVGVAHCPSESNWPKVYPSGPSDSGGNICYYVHAGGYTSGYAWVKSACGQETEIASIKSVDVNGDLVVNELDWLGTSENDYNNDDKVDWTDYELWRAHLGHTCSLGPSCRFSKRLYSDPPSGQLHPADTALISLIVTNNNPVACCVDSVKYYYSGFNIAGRWTVFDSLQNQGCLSPGQADTVCSRFIVPATGHGCVKAKFWTGCCSQAQEAQLNLNSTNVYRGTGGADYHTQIGNASGFPLVIKFTPFLPVDWSFLPGHDTVFTDTGQLVVSIIPSDTAHVGDSGSVVATGYDTGGNEIGSMIWELVIFDTTSEVGQSNEELIIRKFALFQNYPNPFNPQTVIRYALSKGCNVEITIFNILGQKVRGLINEYRSAGAHEILWDGKDDLGKELSSGIYFYRLKTDEFTESKKMILLK